jgi:hypothetical protein
MTATIYSNAIASLLSLLGLMVLGWWLYRAHRMDIFRQDMFALRDQLFDDAAVGKVDFESLGYGLLRITMNGFIRYGHRMSLLQVFVFAAIVDARDSVESSQSFDSRWTEAMGKLDDVQQGLLEGYTRRMHEILVKHLVLTSPLLLALVVPAVLGVVCVSYVARAMRDRLSEIDSAALACGEGEMQTMAAAA